VDRAVGEVAVIQLPASVRKLKIVSLRTLHDQLADTSGAG
jgi:hypothetical protein